MIAPFLQQLLLLAASAVGPVAAQNPPSRPIQDGCTLRSFTMPSWYVDDVRVAGTNVSFHIRNRATNDTATLACRATGPGWNACSPAAGNASAHDAAVRASIQLGNGTAARVLVNQTWSCTDRQASPPLTFAAVGNHSVPLPCPAGAAGAACTAAPSAPLLVRGSLLAPVTITPAYAAGPAGHGRSGCRAAAATPSWRLDTINYLNLTGDGISAVSSQSFTLQLVNPAIDYHASCMAGVFPTDRMSNSNASSSSESSSSGGAFHVACTGNEFGALGSDRYHLQTEAAFDPVTYRFSVNQTWYCDDADPAKPLAITATGSQVLPLSCTDAPLDGITAGHATACGTNASVTVPGRLLGETALPPYSIEDPVPQPDGCTLSSVLHPTWQFSAFEVDQTNGTGGNGTGSSTGGVSGLSFNVILQTDNPGFQFPISIAQGDRVDGSPSSPSWYHCRIGGGGDDGQTLWPYACRLAYTPSTQQLLLQADWYCSDLDPDHPLSFSGVSTTTVQTPLACEASNGVSHCASNDTSVSWTAPITNVSWRTVAAASG